MEHSVLTAELIQAVEECVVEAVSERERQTGLRTLLRLSRSLAVQHMTSLPGTCDLLAGKACPPCFRDCSGQHCPLL